MWAQIMMSCWTKNFTLAWGRGEPLARFDISFILQSFFICKVVFLIGDSYTAQEYAGFLQEFMSAVKQNYGEKVLIQVRSILRN
jgi:hypothetical protein